MSARIALIHATPVSIEPVRTAFEEIWPEAGTSNLLDDSLSTDMAKAGSLTPGLSGRIRSLARYTADAGADGILFTCSAFGAAIEAAAREQQIPVLKPNEAMFQAAVEAGARVAMIATFPPSVAGMEDEFREEARRTGRKVELRTYLVPEAMDALRAGDSALHNELVARCASRIDACDAIMLAHFSTSRALAAVSEKTGVPVLTSPGSAVRLLKSLLVWDGGATPHAGREHGAKRLA